MSISSCAVADFLSVLASEPFALQSTHLISEGFTPRDAEWIQLAPCWGRKSAGEKNLAPSLFSYRKLSLPIIKKLRKLKKKSDFGFIVWKVKGLHDWEKMANFVWYCKWNMIHDIGGYFFSFCIIILIIVGKYICFFKRSVPNKYVSLKNMAFYHI